MTCGRARTHDHRISSQRLTLSHHTGRQTWAYIKLWGQYIDISTLYTPYELAYAHINTLTKVIQVQKTNFLH